MAAANIELVVIHPFGTYQIGDVITDTAAVTAALAEYRTHVSPRAAAVATTRQANSGSDV